MKLDPNDPKLTAYALGELDDAEQAEVKAHLETCAESRRAVEEIRQTAELLTAELKQEPCPALTPRQRSEIEPEHLPVRRSFLVRRWKPLAVAASLAGLAVVGGRVWLAGGHEGGLVSSQRALLSENEVTKLSRLDKERLPSAWYMKDDVQHAAPSPSFDKGRQTAQTEAESRQATISQQRLQLSMLNERLSGFGETELSEESLVRDRRAAGRQPARDVAGSEVDPSKLSRGYSLFDTESSEESARQAGQTRSPRSDVAGRIVLGSELRPTSPSERESSTHAPRVNGIGPVTMRRLQELGDLQSGRGLGRSVPTFTDPLVEGKVNINTLAPGSTKEGGGVTSDFEPLMELIEKTIEVESWDSPGPGTMQQFESSLSLVINETKSLEEKQVAGKLLRKIQEAKAAVRERDSEHNTEAYARIVDNPFLAVGDNPLSTFSIDVDTASYANVRRFLNQGVLPPPDAVRIEEFVNYFRYDYPTPEGDVPFSSHVEIAGCPWAPEHRLVRVALKGREIKEENRPTSNLVFLLDVSGSMSPENKLPLLQKAMRLLVEQLSENDRVAMVVYAGASGLVLDSTTADNKETILSALDELHAGGSTNGGSGIQLAYDLAVANFIKGGTNRVILATDGDFNVGITNEGELHRLIEEKAGSGVFLSVLGFGIGNLKDANLEMLADKGNGNYAYIDTLGEARKVLVEEMGGTLITIAKDVKIQIEFNPKEVAAYRLIGYENRVLAAEDFNDDKKDAGEIGAGHTVTALYEIVPAAAPHPSSPPQKGDEEETQRGVDSLKYQKPAEPSEAALEGELMELKLRYKKPDGQTSKLLKFPVTDSGDGFGKASGDFKFAASVAAFGMLLRGSPYQGNVNLDAVLEMAEDGKGPDRFGYRAEFLELVEKAKTASR